MHRHQRPTLCIFLYFFPPYVFMRVSSSEPGTHLLAKLADQCAPGICLPLCPQQSVTSSWHHAKVLFVCFNESNKFSLRFSCFQNKLLTDRTISLAPSAVLLHNKNTRERLTGLHYLLRKVKNKTMKLCKKQVHKRVDCTRLKKWENNTVLDKKKERGVIGWG